MGQPARARVARGTQRVAPRLRLVAPPRGGAARDARARERARVARARGVFGTFIVVLLALTALGAVRLSLAVRATELSLSETRLQAEIKRQRVEADRLEVDVSSLSTPSRLEGIASTSMRMGNPRSVRYITSTGTPARPASGVSSASDVRAADVSGAGGLGAVLEAIASMSAGEAQALLVGDLGLVGSR